MALALPIASQLHASAGITALGVMLTGLPHLQCCHLQHPESTGCPCCSICLTRSSSAASVTTCCSAIDSLLSCYILDGLAGCYTLRCLLVPWIILLPFLADSVTALACCAHAI